MISNFAKLLILAPCLLMFACAGPKTRPPTEPTVVESQAQPKPGQASYTVRGKKYYILASAAGYDESGLATWYGGRFHGRKTANGERFNARRLTAAHKTLPFNTLAEVTNLQNGRRVTVRINDRGPFSDEHIIDLSRAAAEAIGMKHTLRVRVVAVGEAEPAAKL